MSEDEDKKVKVWSGPEKRQNTTLSEADIDFIAERAAERALEKVYMSIGRSVVSKFLWTLGAGTLAFLAFLKGTGKL